MDVRAHALLRQAAEWRLIGLLFECPVGTWRDDIVALARDIDDPLLGSAVAHALEEASEGLYHSTFGPGGPAPARSDLCAGDTARLPPLGAGRVLRRVRLPAR